MDDALSSAPFADLTTTGRTSGLPRTIEIWFAARNGVAYLLADNRERTQWVRNIVADPAVTLKVGDREFTGRGRIVADPVEGGPARDALVAKYQATHDEDLSAWRDEALLVAIDLDPG